MATIYATGSDFSGKIPNTTRGSRTKLGEAFKLHFVREVVAPPSPLAGRQIPFQKAFPELAQKFRQGLTKVNEGQNINARAIFLEIQMKLGGIEEEWKGVKSLIPSFCMLALAFTHPQNAAEGIILKEEARKETDKLYENRASWDSLDLEEKRIIYATLLSNYHDLLAWTSLEDQPAMDEIHLKIQECEKIVSTLIKPSHKKEVTYCPKPKSTSVSKVYAFTFAALAPVIAMAVLYNRFFVKE